MAIGTVSSTEVRAEATSSCATQGNDRAEVSTFFNLRMNSGNNIVKRLSLFDSR